VANNLPRRGAVDDQADGALRSPADPEAFEEYYADVHMPLVEKIPGVERWEAARVVDTMEGDAPPYYRIFEFWFKDLDGLQASMGSPEGQAAVADIPNYATGGPPRWYRRSPSIGHRSF
jgi:uncharacterized protein (TIGR02118 family)